MEWPPPAPGGDPERQLYFLHIPKTAGISLDGFLRSMYRREDVCPAYLDEELDELDPSSLERYRYVAGHFSLRPLAHSREPPAVVTLVREPSAQLLSAYWQGLREPQHPLYWLWAGRTFAQWLRDPETEFMLRNLQAQFLAGAVHTASQFGDNELYDRAVATLDSCIWYSATEHLGSSLPRLAAALGWPVPTELPRVNAAPESAPPPTAEELELVEARCPVDMRLYQYALSRIQDLDKAAHVRPLEYLPSRGSLALDRPVVVELAEPFWGAGWWPRDPRGDSSAVRWTISGSTASIDLPLRLRRGDRIDLFVAAAPDARLVNDMCIETNGHRAEVHDIHPCPPHFVVPAVITRETGGWTRVTISTPPRAADRGAQLRPRDDRPGVGIERMVLVPDGATQV